MVELIDIANLIEIHCIEGIETIRNIVVVVEAIDPNRIVPTGLIPHVEESLLSRE